MYSTDSIFEILPQPLIQLIYHLTLNLYLVNVKYTVITVLHRITMYNKGTLNKQFHLSKKLATV